MESERIIWGVADLLSAGNGLKPAIEKALIGSNLAGGP